MRRIHYVTADGEHAAGANVTVSDEAAGAAIASGKAVANNDGVWGADTTAGPVVAPVVAAPPIEYEDEGDEPL